MTPLRCSVALLALGLMACDAPQPAAQADTPVPAAAAPAPEIPNMTAQRVYTVDSVTIETQKGATARVEITARGTVRTGGWTKPELRPLIPHVPPKDERIYALVAAPPRPDEMVIQALSPIEATLVIPDMPGHIKRIRIVAETNELTEVLP